MKSTVIQNKAMVLATYPLFSSINSKESELFPLDTELNRDPKPLSSSSSNYYIYKYILLQNQSLNLNLSHHYLEGQGPVLVFSFEDQLS